MSEKSTKLSAKPLGGTVKQLHRESNIQSLSYGRVMPQAVDLEEALLGAIMIDRDAMPKIMDVLTADSFYVPRHQTIMNAIVELTRDGFPVDLLTVREKLKKSGDLDQVGGAPYLAQLTNKVGSAANIEYHAHILSQKYMQRELIRISTDTIQDAFEDRKDVFDLLDDAERQLFDIVQNNIRKGALPVSALTLKVQEELEIMANKEEGLTGIPSGFKELDKYTAGWQRSDLIIVAARPGMGKTSFTLAMAKNAALDHGKPVAFFSLEMSGTQLTQRLLSMDARIPGHKMRNGSLSESDWVPLKKSIDQLSNSKIFIDDSAALNIFELRAKCRRLKLQHNIEMVFIDYLQLMSAGSDNKKSNRQEEISTISRSLKSLAKELNIPIVALSQLSRDVEKRGGNKRPVLSDLRESGAIEQDADIVTFIYRPEYYELDEDGDGGQDKGGSANAEIILSKHRNGATGSVNLNWIGEYALFTEPDNFQGNPFGDGGAQFPNFDDVNTFITRPSSMNGEDDEPPF